MKQKTEWNIVFTILSFIIIFLSLITFNILKNLFFNVYYRFKGFNEERKVKKTYTKLSCLGLIKKNLNYIFNFFKSI